MATITHADEETMMGTTDRPADYTPLTRGEQTALAAAADIEVILTSIDAGHRMAGMALTDDDKAAVRRVDSGASTVDDERDQLIAELGLDYRR
ncbi:hypothetical protein [Gordonia humi]|uniref:Uncharacterized protein n=1 Tax=Gordonia humi TaxID=686429 RepID=A0A840F6N2_9ACTN|nr:hypothetical protein [Gordonia humi]MBB4138068.1 hypothetical protein [Gordonia humi]